MYQTTTQEIPTACPNPMCRAPINQSRQPWGRLQTTCGRDACRKYVSRRNIAERKQAERDAARNRVCQYCSEQLTPTQSAVIEAVMSALMATDQEHGHEQAEQIVQVIEAVRCKHDKIALIEEHAAAAKRRAEKAEEFNRQLEALYKQRIAELEAEVLMYQSLENAIHGIAGRQLEKQPEEM
jgi:membrane-associated HD superfamily phosphohydrolase